MADGEFKLIRGYGMTGAATHDNVTYLDTMPEEPAWPGQEAFAESVYAGKDFLRRVVLINDVCLNLPGFRRFREFAHKPSMNGKMSS
ncbi:MAG: hypothetical protein FWH27_04380 [Planctomycetaceae bacterium]|nr:hypothetical protein [Planctomycetaceae bacterium]